MAFGPSSASLPEPSHLAVAPSPLSALPASFTSHIPAPNRPSGGCPLREKMHCVGNRSDRTPSEVRYPLRTGLCLAGVLPHWEEDLAGQEEAGAKGGAVHWVLYLG